MKHLIIAAVLAATASMALTITQAEAHGRGGFHHRHFGFYAPVVYASDCRWFRTPYGLVKRCFY